MTVYVGMCSAIIAAAGLLKFAVDDARRWWRLAVLILIAGAISLATLWTLRDTGGAPPRPPVISSGITRGGHLHEQLRRLHYTAPELTLAKSALCQHG